MAAFNLRQLMISSEKNLGKEYNSKQSKRLSEKKRKEVLKRDKESCQNCGSHSRLEVHHIVPIVVRGSNEKGNLVTLCKKCHNQVLHPHNHGETRCKADSVIRSMKSFYYWSGKDTDRFEGLPTECGNCKRSEGEVDSIDAHFIVPLEKNGSITEDNVSFLCARCHTAAHGEHQLARKPRSDNINLSFQNQSWEDSLLK